MITKKMARVTLKRGEEQRILEGHPWIFKNEIGEIKGEFQPGDIVEVVSYKNRFLGRGFINPKSQIVVRILTTKKEEVEEEFFRERIKGL